MTEDEKKHALEVLDRVERRLAIARQNHKARVAGAEQRIEEIDKELPEAAFESLVTGDLGQLNAFHDERVAAVRSLEDFSRATPLFERYARRLAVYRYGGIEQGRAGILPNSAPESWFPAYLTAEEPAAAEAA